MSRKTPPAIQAFLRYPLQTGPLGAGLLFYLAGALFFTTGHYYYHLDDTFFSVWLLFIGSGMLGFCIQMIEYGLTILSATANKEPAPLLRVAKLASMTVVPRALKQIMLVAMFLGAAYQSLAADQPIGAALILGYFFLMLPATFIVNALSEELIEMLNPIRLIRCALYCGGYYLAALAVLAAIVLLGVYLFQAGVPVFLALFACLLYLILLFFHAAGLGVAVHNARFFPPVDFNADRQTQQAQDENAQSLRNMLVAAHEDARAGKHKQSVQRIVESLEAQRWQNFDEVFGYIRAWPFSAPGLHIAGRQMVLATARHQFMQALALAEWCVQQRADFVLDDADALMQLGAQAITRPQCVAMLQLLENLLHKDHGLASQPQFTALCLELAGNRLRDEKRFLALRQTFANQT